MGIEVARQFQGGPPGHRHLPPGQSGTYRAGGVVERGCGGRGRRLSRHLRRSEEHTSELQSLMRISYAVFCLKKKNKKHNKQNKQYKNIQARKSTNKQMVHHTTTTH